MTEHNLCRICISETIEIGEKRGRYKRRPFHLRHCPNCHYSFVSNPWTDYDEVYSPDYYAGRGADPYVDYLFEMEQPSQTIRQYEWQGITRAIKSLTTIDENTNWLDYGCGNGGLVRHCLMSERCRPIGFDEGWITSVLNDYGIPHLGKSQLQKCQGTFDVVTAIEVLEHSTDPLQTLRQIRSLLKPGGLFFFTTANARPFRTRLLSEPYVMPEVHVSFFEPKTIAYALALSGFSPEFRHFLPGFDDIIRYKVLKRLHVRRSGTFERILPWHIIAHMVDAQMGITAHPIGWATL